MAAKIVWLVTGASKGLGLALVKKLLGEGYAVAATSRSISSFESSVGVKSEQLLPLEINLSDELNVAEGVSKAISHFGKIDVVVNNAGYGQTGTIEEVSDVEVRNNFEVNVFGMLNVLRAVLPSMRKQKSGHIFNISSIGGYVSNFSGWGVYCSTKFAVAGITEALHSDLQDMGIKVTLIYPGYFRTNFLGKDSLKLPSNPIESYKTARKLINAHVNEIDKNQPGDPSKAANIMVQLFKEKDPPLHMFLGSDAYGMAQDKIKNISAEVEKWKTISFSTDFRSGIM